MKTQPIIAQACFLAVVLLLTGCGDSSVETAAPAPAGGGGGDPRPAKPKKYKTVPCRHWARSGACALGDACTFKHGDEAQPSRRGGAPAAQPPQTAEPAPATKPKKYKTQPCKQWRAQGQCKYGDACTFRHGCWALLPGLL